MNSDINENKYLPKVIDTTNLEIGMIVKNYKELCVLLNEPVKDGTSKKHQLKEWARYFEFERPKWKQSYIILDIYDEPLEKEDKRKKGNNKNRYKKFAEFQVPDEIANHPGVYKIENNEYIYIGSTNKLRKRFTQHYYNYDGNHNKTYLVLRNGGVFTCLKSFEPNTEEKIIREAEAECIRIYQNTNKILLNEELPETFSSKEKIKYDIIKIPTEYTNIIKSILKSNGFLLMNNTVYNKQFDT